MAYRQGYGSGSTGYRTPFDDEEDRGGFGQTSTRDEREQIAIRRMEESSANSLRKLNETNKLATATTEELDTQAETLDRVEEKLDIIHSDLDKSKQSMRKIKSFLPSWSRKKPVSEITDPKAVKAPPKASKAKTPAKKTASLVRYLYNNQSDVHYTCIFTA